MAYQRRYKPQVQSFQQPQQAQRKPKNRAMAHKGKAFERIVDGACKQYKTTNTAHIDRIPTPVEINEVKGKSVKGTLSTAKFTDYMGILSDGRGIAIEAKECSNPNIFPLSNLEEHQYNLLKIYHMMGGLAFLLVYKVHHKKVYRVPFEVLQRIWETAQRSKVRGTQSIPQSVFESECTVVTPNFRSTLHFLEGVI